MELALSIALILLSAAVIGAVLLQAKGGGLGNTFGVSDSVYGTRRGVERTLFQITIALMVVFILLDILAVILFSR